ncbi:MAG: hypothetical protein Q9P01_05770 [Anaerolineae bacterium]|nr:hypothetical protein [Anaerolineae bacterium]
MLAFVHEGEAIQPKAYNPAAGGTGDGISFDGAIFNIYANTEAEGRAAKRGFNAEVMEIIRVN